MMGGYPRSKLFRGRKRARTVGTSTSLVPVSAKKADENQARTIARLVKLTKGIAPERKQITGTGSFANVADTVGAQAGIVAIGQGSDINQRTGNQVRLKSFQIQVRVSTATASIGTVPTNEEFTRFVLVLDKQTISDSTATALTVFQNVANPQFPQPNVEALGRFKWLWVSPLIHHARIAQSAVAGAVTTPLTPSQSPVAQYKNFKMDIPIRYNGTAGGDIQKNAVSLFCITNLGADTVDADYNFRYEFIDD